MTPGKSLSAAVGAVSDSWCRHGSNIVSVQKQTKVCLHVSVCVRKKGKRRQEGGGGGGWGVTGGLDVFILSSHEGEIKQVLTRLSTSLRLRGCREQPHIQC